MKKTINLILFSLVFFIVIFITKNVYAVTPTLEQIADTFNKSSISSKLEVVASANGNKLIISKNSTKFEYNLDNNILSATFSGEDAFSGLYTAMYLVDSIGQLHGYAENELVYIFNSDEVLNYTLENEGLKVLEDESGGYVLKVDISKKIPLMDFSKIYIEVSDLKDLKKYISGSGSAEKNKGYIYFHTDGSDEESTLLIAEKNQLTDCAYKSILSILEVMFESNKAAEYFKSNYPSISADNKEFKGFKIEINPPKDEWEELLIPSDSGYKFMRITIDKNTISEVINNDNINNNMSNDNINNKGANNVVANITTMPRTGEEVNGFLITLYIIIVISVLCVIVLSVITKKKK